MPLPASPTNGQTATLRGITYVYDSTKDTWSVATLYANTISFTTLPGSLQMAGLNVTGNANVGNIGGATAVLTTAANVPLVQNGTSNVTITSGGNISTFIGGNATAQLVVTSTGANISGTANIVGNANVGNLSTTTAIITTGNITTINSGLMQNGNSNVTINANSNVTISAVGGTRITATSTGANITGNLGVSGTITESSTIAIKENVRSLDIVFDKLMSLMPVIYDRIDGTSKDEPGLIAEQVYEVIPELVTLDDQGKPAAIKYSKVSIYVLKMLQDLKREIDSLKER